MKNITGLLIIAGLVYLTSDSYAASAKCVVVEKRGSTLILDCGERAKGFEKKGKVKIKTDRDKK